MKKKKEIDTREGIEGEDFSYQESYTLDIVDGKAKVSNFKRTKIWFNDIEES